ncbi:hypothetical protein TVAG_078750 [Trichomonas vaginalis G3]|uniref:DUF3447 domain-containing protein n=1 Tax=Trichomonas vaginalis (strain ATCC PRA-98 / G3) TaxID=412133 RepID=A2G6S4_TRIV3|nr:myotrophin family [Trichomonas vaginalis G3]EAX87150.1 hypothetical protein TVAG_078750 [Trichomonas vaginalis G3]KAI5546960.1 myotrophin family [Trichomonas vaginalis G3]|eukprot:XP_001300080.1 hypothetical protein [Trichomonas vaginalis G3]
MTFDLSCVPEELKETVAIEDCIFGLTQEKLQEAIKYLSGKGEEDHEFIYNCINKAAETHAVSFKLYGDLWAGLGWKLAAYTNTRFSDYLHRRGLHDQTIFSWEATAKEYEEIYPKDSPQAAVLNEDVDTLKKLSGKQGALDGTVEINSVDYNLLDLAAFSAKPKTFYYLLCRPMEVTRNTVEAAIIGGNPEIIDWVRKKGLSFELAQEIAIENHRNEFLSTLLQHYDLENSHSIKKAILSFNTQFFCFLLAKGYNLKPFDRFYTTPLMVAASMRHNHLVKYLLKHNDINAQTTTGITALMEAAGAGSYELVKFLLANGANKELKDFEGEVAADRTKIPAIKSLL